MVKVFYANSNRKMEAALFQQYLSLFSEAIQTSVKRYLRWQDAHNGLIGKLLLREGLQAFKQAPELANHLLYSEYKRPYIADTSIDFNISHTHGMVVCAISDTCRVGVDVEWKKDMELDSFKNVFTSEEWQTIDTADSSVNTFYTFWTRKEAAMKAIGKGFYLPPEKLDVHQPILQYEKVWYYMSPLHLKKDYAAHIALDQQLTIDQVREIDFYTPS